MPTTKTAASSNHAGNIVRWINHGLEFLWLLAVVGVPLAFVDRGAFLSESELAYVDVPKTVLLRTLVGLMAILWLVECSLQHRVQIGYHFAEQMPHLRPAHWFRSLVGWLHRDPTRWVTAAVALYLLSTLISTALSESFRVSMWGLVPGQDTYPAYTIICYVVLFGVVATHVRTKAQAERLLWAVAFMGALVGGYSVAQAFGYDIFTLLENPGTQRSGSTMGNAIVAGSVLLMTLPISLVAGTTALDNSKGTPRVKWIGGLWILVLALQISGTIFTFSRGPWIGTAAALLSLLALLLLFSGRRQFLRAVTLLGLTVTLLGLAALVASVPAELLAGDRPTTRSSFDQRQPVPLPLIPNAVSSIISIGVEAAAVGSSLGISEISGRTGGGGGGLSGRIGIWKNSGRLILKRPWFEFGSPSPRLLRFSIGYGPDMFKYAYQLENLPRGPDRPAASERFAHNILIHQGVELGLLGLLTTLGLFASLAIVGLRRLFRGRQGDSTFYNLLIVGLMATTAGRFAEQMVGVASVSDLTIFWVLLALFAALPAAEGMSQMAPSPAQAPMRGRRRRLPPTTEPMISGAQIVVPVVVALCLVAGIAVLTWTKSINYVMAGFEAREGLNRIRDSEFQNALVSLDRAIDLAPDVSVYHTLRAAVYSGYRRQIEGPKEPQCGQQPNATPYYACLARQEYLSHGEASKQRSFALSPRLNLADSALTLALMDRDLGKANEAIRLYHEVAQLAPQAWRIWVLLGAAHIQLGQPEAALEPLEKSLAFLEGTPRSAIPRLLVGMAYLQLAEPTRAVQAFNEAIQINPNLADGYTNRGASYNDLGQYQRALQDLDEAIKLKPEMALAYVNRGNSYGNLEQFQMAIEDYDEAIRLDPRLALAFSNRALAYTYLGRDDDARMDVERATQLGVDPGPILATMKEVKANR